MSLLNENHANTSVELNQAVLLCIAMALLSTHLQLVFWVLFSAESNMCFFSTLFFSTDQSIIRRTEILVTMLATVDLAFRAASSVC